MRRLRGIGGNSKFIVFTLAYYGLAVSLMSIFELSYEDLLSSTVYFPFALLCISLPFAFAFSLWKAFQENKKTQDIEGDVDLFYNCAPGNPRKYINVLENKLAADRANQVKVKNYYDLLGRLFSVFPVIAPLVTWVFSFFVIEEDAMSNLNTLTFSAMITGTVSVTIAIALLRHSKTLQGNIYKLDGEIYNLRKAQVLLLTKVTKENRAWIEKELVSFLLFRPDDERQEVDNKSIQSILDVLKQAASLKRP